MTIEQQIEIKNKELADLKQQILLENEKSEQEKIQNNRDNLEKEIEDLKRKKELETDIITWATSNEQKELQKEILPTTYELIKWTVMYKSLLTHYNNDEKKVEAFANNIEKPVKTYLTQELVWVNPQIINSLSIAIQFSMMEQLKSEWQDKMAELFSGFGNMNTWTTTQEVTKGNISSVFTWMFWFFKNSWWFLTLAKRIDNVVTTLRANKDQLQWNVTKLINPLECKNIINDHKWEKIENVEGKTLEQLWILWDVTIDEQWRGKLTAIANNKSLNMNAKMIESLEKSTEKAELFLQKRTAYKDKMIDMVSKWEDWMSIGIPWIFTLGDILWVKKWKWLLSLFNKEKGIGKIINLIFKAIWFWWIDGFKKEVIQQKISKNMSPDGRKFITGVLDAYSTETANTTINPEDDIIKKITWKEDGKLAVSYTILKKQIEDVLKTNPEKIVSPVIAQEFKLPVEEEVNTATGEKTLKIWSLAWFDVWYFVDQYLQVKWKKILENEDVMKKITSSTNPKWEFLVAIVWWIVAGDAFIDGVEMWIQTAYMYATQTQTQTSTQPTQTEKPQDTTETINKPEGFIAYIKNMILSHESGGNYWAVNKFDVNGVSLWLLQWHADRAKDLMKTLKAKNEPEFMRIMGQEFADLDFKDKDKKTLRNTAWDDTKAENFEKLMQIQEFKDAMDEVLEEDVKRYIQLAKADGLTDPKMIAYYCNMANWWIAVPKDAIKWATDLKTLHENNVKPWWSVETFFGWAYEAQLKKIGEDAYTSLQTVNFEWLDISTIV